MDTGKTQCRRRGFILGNGVIGGGAIGGESEFVQHGGRDRARPAQRSGLVALIIGKPGSDRNISAAGSALHNLKRKRLRLVVENVESRQSIFWRNVVVVTEDELVFLQAGHWVLQETVIGRIGKRKIF